MIGTAPAALTGFTPNVVLRESQVEERPDALAAISQANLRGLQNGIPGTLVLQIEALQQHGAEHRRVCMLSPARPEEVHGNTISVLSIQDLVVADGVVAELTLSVPLFDFRPWDENHNILETLRLLPPEERAKPPTTSDVPEPTLDVWASSRAGAPREDLSVVALPELVLPAEPLTVSSATAATIVKGASRGLFPKVKGEARDELAEAGLVDRKGNLVGDGFWYGSHFYQGLPWVLHTTAPANTDFRFWMTDSTTVFLSPHPGLSGKYLLGWTTTYDFFRVMLSWVGHRPSWPLEVNLSLAMRQVQVKVEDGIVPSTGSPDEAEFCAQRWSAWALDCLAVDRSVTWFHTASRGDALAFAAPPPAKRDQLILEQDPLDPLWAVLIQGIVSAQEEQL
ncbi:hypothetical protein EII34_02655 [Arachnia propionica]|uniref:Uncharacterized protein n=1 Tax=Arachnia propionica TaxID=1750 RepID=A0A3P1TAX5_9ACTN|nr:hypothetical protein [Arachnia propionica]RRD06549.1 hypothetical protein EII34_02655 [Arachnia propionica]